MRIFTRTIQSRAVMLWENLLKHHPSCSDLGYVIKNVPLLREAAAKEMLLRHDAAHDDLLCVMRYCEEMRIAAWDRFVLRKPSNIHLRYVIETVPSLAEVAGRMLLGRFPEKNFLFCVMERISLLCNEAWEQYRHLSPANDELCWVIRYIPQLRIDAGMMLLCRDPSNTHLRCVAIRVPSLALDAGKMLLRHHPCKDDIQCVRDHVPQLKEEAERMLVRQASDGELRALIGNNSGTAGELAEKEFLRRTRKLSTADKEYIHAHVPSLHIQIERYQNERSKARILEELITLEHATHSGRGRE